MTLSTPSENYWLLGLSLNGEPQHGRIPFTMPTPNKVPSEQDKPSYRFSHQRRSKWHGDPEVTPLPQFVFLFSFCGVQRSPPSPSLFLSLLFVGPDAPDLCWALKQPGFETPKPVWVSNGGSGSSIAGVWGRVRAVLPTFFSPSRASHG